MENSKYSNHNYHVQDIKYVQHKNVNMTWDYRKFPRHPVSAEKCEIIVINTIIFHDHYRVEPELGKVACVIRRIPCACPACVAQLDKYWSPTITPSSQSRYAHVENCYYNIILEQYNNCIIMNFLDSKTPQVDFDNIYELFFRNVYL